REAEILCFLKHENILGFVGILDDPKRMCIVMSWMEGGELNGFLKRNPDAPRAPLAHQICVGLDYLRSQFIVHGDLKGANILIDEQGNPHISDFGSSHIVPCLETTRSSHELLQNPPQSTCGTYRWIAPEILIPHRFDKSASRATFESDVFSFTMVLYEARGDIPFYEKSDMAANLAILEGARPPNISDEIWILASECWRQHPTDRPRISSVLL
ncbi:kinase-like domain-containing protein, partial [Mycena galopus ATCC 62051]